MESQRTLQMLVTGAILAVFTEKGSAFDVSVEAQYDETGKNYLPVVRIVGNQSGEVVEVEVREVETGEV